MSSINLLGNKLDSNSKISLKIETHSGEFVTNNTEKSDRRTILRHAERSCQTSQIQCCNKKKLFKNRQKL